MEYHIVIAAPGVGQGQGRRLPALAGARARRMFGIGQPERTGFEGRCGGLGALEDALDPGLARLPGGAPPSGFDARKQPLEHGLAREPGGRVVRRQPRLELLAMHLELARRADPAAHASEPPACLPRGTRLEQSLPEPQRLGQPPARHAQIVNRFGVGAVAHAAGRRGKRLFPGGEIPEQAGGTQGTQREGGLGAHSAHSPGRGSSMGCGCRASRDSTRSERSSAVSSTGRVASSVSKPYSRDR